MSKASAARRLAAAAAYGGRGLSLVSAALYGILVAEALAARKMIGRATKPVFDATGYYGRGRPGPPLEVALLGDSSALGYGVDQVEHTPGAYWASGMAAAANRRVHLRSYPVIGAQSSDLRTQVDRVLEARCDVAMILVGPNDVTHMVRPAASVRHLGEAVHRLRHAGVEVVVGTCPDLGTIRPILPPLRQLARHWSRRLAAAQAIVALNEGARTVSLGDILGPEFAAEPAELFGPDKFHPSPEGYHACADVLLPTTLVALGLVEPDELLPTAQRGEGVRQTAAAAVEAADRAGTELDPLDLTSSRRTSRGRWVELRHRRHPHTPEAETPSPVDVP
ncbi:SGNH/GDSL hydrolase family protein [Nocardioides jishulii]|uniref:SGNH/GDSL hydrolase family protein n=1 Tax=Nocardioides jishulii TaxID=2575440 RepID=A0A4U2YH99_9ACTN|nr:SGNH/GDSL hydrolase family protein [Nocardioides jishulii]QCX26671.1 SGNH/GDSL hydrolase family protein [Nocardioides jishulii]TKI60359.1 SGNH/GDSL hydrolase family protein [Nocardioides jishulii]